MKKIVGLSVLGVIIVALVVYALLSRDNDEISIFDDKETLIGFSVLSSIMTLHNNLDGISLHQSQSLSLMNAGQADTHAILSEIADLTPYLDLVSTFMGGDNNFSVSVSLSNLDDYEHQMIITTVNMEGETISYVMHYNETFGSDYDEEHDPEEYDSVIEGIMVIDDVIYTIYGERQIDEGEESLELTAKFDDENYVTIDYEIEIDADERSIEFDYEMFRDNQLVMRTELQFKEDNEETELSLKLIKGTRETEYDFEVTIDGNKRKIEIAYKISEEGNVIEEGEAEVKITYNEETSQYFVRYEIETSGQSFVVDVDYLRPE